MTKTEKILPIIFAAVGVLSFVGGAWYLQHTRTFVANSTETSGTVVELVARSSDEGFTYAPVVAFETQDGEQVQFQNNVSSDPPAHEVGETVTVLYSPEDPEEAKIKSFLSLWFGPIVIMSFGLIFATIGFGIIAFQRKKQARITRLIQQGATVQAEITDVSIDTSYTVNNKHPYRVYAQYTDAAGVHTFKSDAIWFDPSEYLRDQNHIPVYVDPPSMEKYHVDLSLLPKQ